LTTVAVDGTAGIGKTEGCAALGGRKETCTNSANEGPDEMSVEDIEGVVDCLEDLQVAFAKIERELVTC